MRHLMLGNVFYAEKFQEWGEYVYNNIFKKHYDTWIAKQKNLKLKENSKDYEI